jgi:hypothetical protein
MKRFLLALTIVGLLLPLAPKGQAATEISLNFFYDNLSPYGNWIEVADYGYCFQPNVAVNNPNWRPYADGYWAYTDVGWTWVSYEDFGWATYHYGRWTNLADFGWMWVPGYDWGPAWVSWRTGGDYIGWAPLPPAGTRIYEGRAITGQVDVEFDIGPQFYNFIDIRYIGEPVLRDRIFEPQRNVTIINRTVNVTNITYNNAIVYNYGPDYNRLSQYSTRPIQRLSLQRETTVGANLTAQGGGRGNFNRVNGNQLVVVAPQIQKSAQPIAPRQVKAKVQQPKVERGWQGVANRQQIQEQMKKENAQNVPPPSFQPQQGRAGQAATGAQQAPANAGQQQPAAGQQQPAKVGQQQTEQAPATGTERQTGQRARKTDRTQQTPRGEQATEPSPAENAAAEETTGQQTTRTGRAQRRTPPRTERAEGTEEAGQTEQGQPARAERKQQRTTEQAEQPPREQTEEPSTERGTRATRAPRATGQGGEREQQAQEPQRVGRGQRPEQAQPTEESQRGQRGQQAQQPSREQRPERAAQQGQLSPRPEQARQPQAAQGKAPAGQEGKGKKKKPTEEESPHP